MNNVKKKGKERNITNSTIRLMQFGFAMSVLAAFCPQASAQMIINLSNKAVPGQSEVSLGLGFFSADYEYPLGDFYLKRNFLSGTLAYGISDLVDFVVGGAFSFKTDAEYHDADGNGFMIASGLRSRVWQDDAVAIHLGAQILYFDEDYGQDHETLKPFSKEESASGTEVTLGAYFVYF